MQLLTSHLFDSKVHSEQVTVQEKWLGYFLGPIGVALMNGILGGYLNVYYTDVINIAAIWGGLFLSTFPFVCKIIDALTFVMMGRLVDWEISPQGKARPWILLSTPILLVSMILLFTVPDGSDWLRAGWIFLSYNLFYAVGYTAYSTSHTLLVPLSSESFQERSSLSVVSNSLNMITGTVLAILFPCVLVPLMGVNRSSWMQTMLVITCICCPMLLMEYFFTKERVTLAQRKWTDRKKKQSTSSLQQQLKSCLKSRSWIFIMIYMIVMQLFNALSSASVFYYCNWVLGSYNDGYTQALFYGVGNAPLGLGVFLCGPLCKKYGRRNAMMYGFLLSVVGCLICLLAPRSLPVVLLGQFVKAVGLIPSSFMVSAMLADALDDVNRKSGERCDGFSSSVFNIIVTLSGGVALCIFNFCLTRFGYQAPAAETLAVSIPVQNAIVQKFFIFGAIGSQLVGNMILAVILFFSKEDVSAR